MTQNKTNISAALAAAACTLLGAAPIAPVQAQELDKWEFDTTLLYYGEDADRVQDLSLGMIASLPMSSVCLSG